MKIFRTIILILSFGWVLNPAFAEETEKEENARPGEAPLSITIRPDYDKFDGTFIDGMATDAPRIETSAGCPRNQILSCDITNRFWDKGNKINATIAKIAYEKAQEDWGRPELRLVMGGRYAKLPDYLILASMGIDPGLDPLDPWPQPSGQMYGSLWFANTTDIGDRMAGPVMLARNSKNWVKRYNGKRGICIGVC